MAIAFRASNTAVAGSGNITAAIPAGQLVNDMVILIAAGKPFDLGWSVTTSGWTSIGRGQSGTTASGIDVGSMTMEVWYKVATADPEPDPTVTEGTPIFDVISTWILVYSKADNEAWLPPTVVFGSDEVTGTSISATMSADNNVTAGDKVIASLASNTDGLSPYTTDVTATQTGVTFGTWGTRQDNLTTTGGDMSWDNSDASVTAGPSSAAAVLSATGTTSGGADRTILAYTRLRVGPFIPGQRTFPSLPLVQNVQHRSPI